MTLGGVLVFESVHGASAYQHHYVVIVRDGLCSEKIPLPEQCMCVCQLRITLRKKPEHPQEEQARKRFPLSRRCLRDLRFILFRSPRGPPQQVTQDNSRPW